MAEALFNDVLTDMMSCVRHPGDSNIVCCWVIESIPRHGNLVPEGSAEGG